jgi:hypothetical protein
MRKGFYIRQSKDKSLILNINRTDFVAFLQSLSDNEDWVKFRIYERDNVDERGFTHNMEALQITKNNGEELPNIRP